MTRIRKGLFPEWRLSGHRFSNYGLSGFRFSRYGFPGFRFSGYGFSGIRFSGFGFSGFRCSGYRCSGYRCSGYRIRAIGAKPTIVKDFSFAIKNRPLAEPELAYGPHPHGYAVSAQVERFSTVHRGLSRIGFRGSDSIFWEFSLSLRPESRRHGSAV